MSGGTGARAGLTRAPGATSSEAGVRIGVARDRGARPCVSAVTAAAARLWWMLSMVIG